VGVACLQQYHLASPGRLCPARWPSTNGEEVLPRPHGHSGTVWLARTGAVLHSGPAPVARRHYWNDPAMAAMSDQPLQAPAGVAAWRRWREGTPRTAQLRRHRTANPGRCQPVQRPGALGKGALPGGLAMAAWSGRLQHVPSSTAESAESGHCHGDPSTGSTVWPAPAGIVWRSGLALAMRGRFWGGLAVAARFGHPQQAPSGAGARCPWRGGAAGAAWIQQHSLAGYGRCHPSRQPNAGGEEVLPGWPHYGCMVWLALAGVVQCRGPVPAAMGRCLGSLATAALSGYPQQAQSYAVARHQQ